MYTIFIDILKVNVRLVIFAFLIELHPCECNYTGQTAQFENFSSKNRSNPMINYDSDVVILPYR